MQGGTAAVDRVFREEYGRLTAPLVRRFGDIAKEAAGEALMAALEKWPESGIPGKGTSARDYCRICKFSSRASRHRQNVPGRSSIEDTE